MMKELVVISGKGGTGKTSITASFAALADGAVMADCDVDAADLHLVLEPEIKYREEFSGGKQASIDPDKCTGCGKCMELCRFDAIVIDAHGKYRVDPISCEGCGVCAWFCPESAVIFGDAINGEWFISETRFGPMVHARLGIAEENSGKLVSLVRNRAQAEADKRGLDLVIVDGSPGIGCPVIASVTGADMVLAVTEPTLSGRHDLERVAKLTAQFQIPTAVCVNKYDLNYEMAAEIEAEAAAKGMKVMARVRYDKAVTLAQIQKKSVVEFTSEGSAADIRELWRQTSDAIKSL